MGDLSDKVATVIDLGNYQELAIRLARDFGKVNFFKPWKRSAPSYHSLVIGQGFDEINRVRNLFDVVNETDIFIFPDVYDADLQLHLERLGKRVWGSRRAEEFEFNRGLFKRTLKEVGLPVPEYVEIQGMTALREFLEDHADEEWFIKRHLLRGDGETCAAENIELSRAILGQMDAYYGGLKELFKFIVEKKVEAAIEVAYDGICVDGQFTDGFVGCEAKNRAYIAAFTAYQDMNEHVRTVNEAFAPKLKECRMRSMWGTEIRVSEDGKPYFIDATCRMPSPPGELMLEMIGNLSEIIWHGSVGEFVQAEPVKPFGVEVMVYADWEDASTLPMQVPDKVRQWFKFDSCCKVGNTYHSIQFGGDEHYPWIRSQVAEIVAIGDSVEEAIELAKGYADELIGLNCEVTIEALADALKDIRAGEKEGVEFSANDIPDPSTILED
jgi:hypothetical protein